MNDNKNKFYWHHSSKRKTKENMSPSLNGEGKQITRDVEKAAVFNGPFPPVIVDKVCP